MLNDFPSVVVKKRQMDDLLAYVMDQKLTIRVVPRGMADEWEITFEIEEVLKAVALGMFLRELKLELAGFQMPALPSKTKTKKPSKSAAEQTTAPASPKTEPEADKESPSIDKGPAAPQADPDPVRASSSGLFQVDNAGDDEPDPENMF
jgi:hypothetical protein